MTPPGEPQYFGAFTGYNPPVKPKYPIDYTKAESGNAFSMFTFDVGERVVLFEQYRINAKAVTATGFGDPKPGLHFFAIDSTDSSKVGAEITLENTKKSTEYYRVRVAEDGAIKVERVNRWLTLRHRYAYWDNGKLREARYESPDQPTTVEQFNRKGKRESITDVDTKGPSKG
jgi:hypothetical protein